ncbi:MAG: hypothetical protein DMG13_25165 [Acidobacteria bacterium]|nr:MAG: hypothetical protein DMG13_25165 [Acidobacteriota bacterium]
METRIVLERSECKPDAKRKRDSAQPQERRSHQVMSGANASPTRSASAIARSLKKGAAIN